MTPEQQAAFDECATIIHKLSLAIDGEDPHATLLALVAFTLSILKNCPDITVDDYIEQLRRGAQFR